ncbi:hypothetical protein M6B38_376675 [Iris pallida]|uniref:Uncharacterized protein n=1 Tax=Iris pallida TaxID=29817 RepID=A0AAX6GA26_IRIPA|nr:hypothetical protein M6B38_376675 [Iris pallida]
MLWLFSCGQSWGRVVGEKVSVRIGVRVHDAVRVQVSSCLTRVSISRWWRGQGPVEFVRALEFQNNLRNLN